MSISMGHTYTTTLVILCVGLLSQPAFAQWMTTTTKSPGPQRLRTTTATSRSPESFDIRLVDGPTPAEGRLEVQYKGRWGTVCDDGFEILEATVACRQLGFDLALTVRNGAYYGPGNGNILLDDINCQGDEKMVSQCKTKDWGSHDCNPSEDAGIQCGNFSEPFDIRLVDGPTSSEGRLEVHHQGIWGTVCDDGFESADADVVCRQLGYNYALEVKDSAVYGQGDGIIFLDEINCQGDEPLLSQCRLMGWGSHDCDPSEDVGVRCGNTEAGKLPIRLSESHRPNTGNVQAFYKGNWGYICDSNGWSGNEADVACRQLGYEGGGRPNNNYYIDYGLGNTFVISTISCNGDEDDLGECSIKAMDLKDSTVTQYPWYDYQPGTCWSEASVTCKTSTGGLTGGKIAGITVTCILLVIMVVLIPLIVLRCKKPKTTQSQTTDGQQQGADGTTANGTTISGEPIQAGATTVMFMNSHTGAPQMMMPYGSPAVAYGPPAVAYGPPAVAYGQNGQIIYQQQPIGQQPFNSQQQTCLSQTGYPNGAQAASATGFSADIKQIPPPENNGGDAS